MKLLKPRKKKHFALVATSDIAFLLLIFLIVTANLEYNPEITVPEMTNTTDFLATETRVVLLEITGDGELFIDSIKIETNELSNQLKKLSDDFIYRIYADQSVPFFLIANTLHILQKNHKQKILLMIEKEL